MGQEGFNGTSEAAIDTLRRLLAGKADAYEIYISSSRGLSVEAKDGGVDALKARKGSGVGVRTISGGRLGFGFSSVLTEEALKDMVSGAVEASHFVDEDKFLTLPSDGTIGADASGFDILDPAFDEISEDEKIATALRIEETARSKDSRIKRVRKASYSETLSSTRVVNSNGVDRSFSATFFSGSVTAVAEEGDESQMGWEFLTSHKRASIDPVYIGESAADRALGLLGASTVKSVKCPAVIENTVACELLESLSISFLGDNVAKGKSMLIGKKDKPVASTVLNVWDDGLMPGGWATSPFDGEGAPKTRTLLLSEGILKGYLYDTYWANREGTSSTGNAARGGYKGLPSVGVSNLYIEKGDLPVEGLFKEMVKGLFITEVLGVHMINTVSGDFSLGASGFWVEDGQAAYPVRGMAVSGNLLDLFTRVVRCGSDFRFLGSIGAPSLLVNEVEASGS